MAADVAEAMEALRLDTAYVMGDFTSGMIAQWLVSVSLKRFQLILAATANLVSARRERVALAKT